MPLYMDIHKGKENTFNVEAISWAPMEDLRVEQQFGVKQIMYWVNEKDQTVFCPMEGPNAMACRRVHETSHGGTAFNIIEVSLDKYNLFMAKGTGRMNNLAYQKNGKLDSGHRTMIMVDTCHFYRNRIAYRNSLKQLVEKFNDKRAPPLEDREMVSFSSAHNVVQCAIKIAKCLKETSKKLAFHIAFASRDTIYERGTDIFKQTNEKLKLLRNFSLHRYIYSDASAHQLTDNNYKFSEINYGHIRIVTSSDFQFCAGLQKLLKSAYNSTNFTCNDFANKLAMSKSKTYRKIKALTGISPNTLIREYPLQHSLKKLKQNGHTVTDIAYSLSFNSPTYFTRTFKEPDFYPPHLPNNIPIKIKSYATLHGSAPYRSQYHSRRSK